MITEKLNHGFNTLLQAIKVIEADGYVTTFMIKAEGLEDPITKRIYTAKDIKKVEYTRIYAPLSEPDEESVLYLFVTNDGMKGWISDSYGIYSDSHLTSFVSEIENLNTPNK